MKGIGTNALLVSVLGAVLELARDVTLPVVIRSLAALVTCAIAIAIVVYVYRQERGHTSVGVQARGKERAGRARRRAGRRRAADR